ncbi:hypothetical protein PWT90_10468 [Aphanocladium album]|nr:hypothetical protein PWT90_10468 [Aphanocladium album]
MMHIHRHTPCATTPPRPEIHHTSTHVPSPATTPIFYHSSAARDGDDAQLGASSSLPAELGRNDDTGLGAFGILIPVSAAAWVLFGASCILCINGKGRAGRWVPEWYLDSRGTRRDQAAVAAWWLAVMLLWPVILPALLAGKLARGVRGAVAKRCRKRGGDDEESQTAAAAGEKEC